MEHNEELDLEDIIREFSDQPELEELIREYAPPKEKKPAQSVSGDTIRLEPMPGAPAKPAVTQQTVRFTGPKFPADPPYAPTPSPVGNRPTVEPFSEGWEPEYEEPMGNYPQRDPIHFPNQRLKILRDKLTAGPEKRFYELTAAGTFRPKLMLLLAWAVFALSMGITLAYTGGTIGIQYAPTVVFCQLLSVLLSALLVLSRLVQGIANLARGKFTLSAFLLITAVVCLADGVLALQQKRISCCNLFCLEAAVAQWAFCHDRVTELRRMDTLRRAQELTAITRKADLYDEDPGCVTAPGDPDAFLQHYQTFSAPEKILQIYAAICVLASIALAVAVGAAAGWTYGLRAMSTALLVGLPATAFICIRRPEALLEKRLHSLGTVLCGWQGVKAVEKDTVFPITHTDLFPQDTVKLNGMKFYGAVDPDMVLCYAGSLVAYEGGSLTAIFEPLMSARYIRHARVEEYTAYPGGLSALVDGEPVVVGTLGFMQRMGIEVPEQTRLRYGVYAAVDGVLSGVFAVQYARNKQAAAGLRNICSYRAIRPVLVTPDFMLTEAFLRDTLKVQARNLEFPDRETCMAICGKRAEAEDPVIALTTRKGLPQRTFAVTGALALASAEKCGTFIHILGGILGLVAVAVLALIGAWQLLTPINLLLYSLLWMLPGWLITQWTRYI